MKTARTLVLIPIFLSLIISRLAYAWDGVATGVISRIDTVNETNNFELRVFLGSTVMCNNTTPSMNTWGNLNSSDPNYKTAVANLMLAFSTGKTVTIFTTNEGGGCHIHYVSVQA
jgi:hypothetical protein